MALYMLEETEGEQEEFSDGHIPASQEDADKHTHFFLRRVCSELQLIRKQLSTQRSWVHSPPTKKDAFMLFVEKLLCYTRVLFSLLFFAYIIMKWRSDM